MALTPEQLKKYGLSASDATASNHDAGIVQYKGQYYQIDDFERQQSEGIDTDQGATFSSSLEADSGKEFTNFNTATDVEGALAALGGEAPKDVPIEYSPELQAAHDRHEEYTRKAMDGTFSEEIFGPKRSSIAEGGVDDAAAQQKAAAQVFSNGFKDRIKREVTTEIKELGY